LQVGLHESVHVAGVPCRHLLLQHRADRRLVVAAARRRQCAAAKHRGGRAQQQCQRADAVAGGVAASRRFCHPAHPDALRGGNRAAAQDGTGPSMTAPQASAPDRAGAPRWVVLKFGGTSVSSRARWDTIATLAQARRAEGKRVLVVVSALSGVTNALQALIDAAAPTAASTAAAQ